MTWRHSAAVIQIFLCSLAPKAMADWTYTSQTASGDCAALPTALNTGFTVEPVVSRALFPSVNPIRIAKMAFFLNSTSGKTDIYITEKGGSNTPGRVLYYNGTANTLTSMGTIPNVFIGFNESGLLGVALNPKTFAQDNYLYFMYATGTGATASATNGWRISRFKVTTSGTAKTLDLASEKILLHIPAGTSGRWHTGGSMHFDNFGNLYISLGDNESLANGPANTADLRGGILRITPDDADPKGYTVPAGNFGEYWASQWQAQGNTARATAYRNPAIVKPEIYVKGSRNPYSFSVDPNRLGWVEWSECGPDAQTAEEHNLTTKPAFSGWPFWAGNGTRQTAFAVDYDEPNEPKDSWATFNPAGMSTATPVNNWANAAGYDTLPPMHVPFSATTTRSCSQGGPVVRYDGRVANAGKMPPHLDNTVMYTDFNLSTIWAVKVNPSTGATVGTPSAVFTNTGAPFRTSGQPSIQNPIDFQQGPDGALYMVSWGAGCCNGDRGAANGEGIARIKYTGTCQDPSLFPENTTSALSAEAFKHRFKWDGRILNVLEEGRHELRVLDMGGRTVFSSASEGGKEYALRQALQGKAGVYLVKITTAKGTFSQGLPLF